MPFLSCFSGLRRQTQTLSFPLHFAENIAVLESGFRMERGMREFEAADWRGIEMFRPSVVVAPVHSALCMAERKLQGLLTLPSLEMAMVVLTRVDGKMLRDHHRDRLWHAFGVPVFEQLGTSEGTVFARECEVHDGLHVAPAALPKIACEVVTGQCECGAETPRLRNLAPIRQRAAAAAA